MRRAATFRLTVPLLAALLAAACGKPGVGGTVLPTDAERKGLPWRRAEVRLVRGDVAEMLQRLFETHRNEALAEARRRVLDPAQADLAAKTEELQRVRAALAEEGIFGDVPRTCLTPLEARLAAAKRGFNAMLTGVTPQLAALGITASDAVGAVEQLRAAVQAKADVEARRMAEEYLHTLIVQETRTVLAIGTGGDRLCWSVENTGDVAVRFRGMTLWYDGKPLPAPVAERIWVVPPREAPLRIPHRGGAESDALLGGERYELCVYARRARLPAATLDQYGLWRANPARSGGEWRVQWEEVSLTDGRKTDRKRGPTAVPLASVFSTRLQRFESTLDEAQPLKALTDSELARAVGAAEAVLLLCHRAIETDKQLQQIDRIVRAIEQGKEDDAALEARLWPIVQELLREPLRLSSKADGALLLIETTSVTRQSVPVGTDYEFDDIPPGRYTLIAKSPEDAKEPKVWLMPFDLVDAERRDLTRGSLRDGTLAQLVENILIGQAPANLP